MKKKLNIAILTVSDTRNSKTDKSGELLKNKILNSHHNLFEKKICKDKKILSNKIIEFSSELSTRNDDQFSIFLILNLYDHKQNDLIFHRQL